MTTIYVSPNGDDHASGTIQAPLATIAAAVARANTSREASEIILRGGVYHQQETLRVESAVPSMLIRAEDGEDAIVDGGIPLAGWRRTTINGKAAWEAPAPVPVRRLYWRGKPMTRAAFPKHNAFYRVRNNEKLPLFQGTDTILTQEGSFNPEWSDIAGIEVCLIHLWISEYLPVAEYDPSTGKLRSTSRSCFSVNDGDAEYRFENVREALQEEGEFYYDATRGMVVVILDAQLDAPGAEVPVAPMLGALLVLQNSAKVTLQGLHFRHAGAFNPANTAELDLRNGMHIPNPSMLGNGIDGSWLDTPEKPPQAASPQGAVNVPGIAIVDHCRECQVKECLFEAAGWYGLQIACGCREITIGRNTFRHLGAGGIRIGGATILSGSEAERTCEITATNNHIHDCGEYFMGSTGIFVPDAFGCLIEHNHIHDLPYSGISIGWVWGFDDSVTRENRIGWNRIENLGKNSLLSDMGGIYLLGVQPGTRVYNNYIAHITRRYYGGWGIYTDEGSSHIVVENNIAWDCASNAFHQHFGRENILRWNIFALGGDEALRLSRGNEHWKRFPGENFTCALASYQNVLLTDGKPFIGSATLENLRRPTFIADGNFYWALDGKEVPLARSSAAVGPGEKGKKESSRQEWLESGQDASASFQDPLFANPRMGDFSFPTESPLAKARFPQLDMQKVGIVNDA